MHHLLVLSFDHRCFWLLFLVLQASADFFAPALHFVLWPHRAIPFIDLAKNAAWIEHTGLIMPDGDRLILKAGPT